MGSWFFPTICIRSGGLGWWNRCACFTLRNWQMGPLRLFHPTVRHVVERDLKADVLAPSRERHGYMLRARSPRPLVDRAPPEEGSVRKAVRPAMSSSAGSSHSSTSSPVCAASPWVSLWSRHCSTFWNCCSRPPTPAPSSRRCSGPICAWNWPGAYRLFRIYARKPRIIAAAPFRDRVVHHALMNLIELNLDRIFIYDSYACRRGKGVHAAVDRY